MKKAEIRRKTRRIIALLLSAMLVLSLGCVPAFAASIDETGVEEEPAGLPSPEELVSQQSGVNAAASNAVNASTVKPGKIQKLVKTKNKKWVKNKTKYVKYVMSWSSSKNSMGYQLQWSYNSNFKNSKIRYTNVRSWYIVFYGKSIGKHVYFRVRGYRVSGNKVYYGPWRTIHYTSSY